MKDRPFGTADYFKITMLVFAITALWQSLHTIILPLRLLDFVDESQKNTYLGLLTFTGLLLAMIAQPIMATLSDRSGFSWGRRRPFILLGIMMALLFLPGIGLAGSYAVLFASYCLLQISSNTAQGPYQAFIPEMTPERKRGRASGVKGLLEILGGVAIIYPIAIFMDNYATGEGSRWLWLSLAIPGGLLLLAMVATVWLVKESPGRATTRLSILATLYQPFKLNIRTNSGFLWFLVSRLLVFVAFATVQQFALYYLRDVVGVTNPAAAAATFLIVAVAGMGVVVYFAGRLSDRLGRKPINIASAVLSAIGILIIILSQSYSSTLVAAGILGVAIGAFSSTNWALATDLVTKGEEARYLALANMATAGGAAIARLMGPMIDFFEKQRAGLGYQAMLVACMVFFVLGGLLLLKIKPPKNEATLPNPRRLPAPE